MTDRKAATDLLESTLEKLSPEERELREQRLADVSASRPEESEESPGIARLAAAVRRLRAHKKS